VVSQALTPLTVEWTTPNHVDARVLIESLSAVLAAITGDDGRSSFSALEFNKTTDAFVILRQGAVAVACGSLRWLDEQTCELKRMYSSRPGYGKRILAALETKASAMGYQTSVLSTRIVNQRAVDFYCRQGYEPISPYGKYIACSQSICLGKSLMHAAR